MHIVTDRMCGAAERRELENRLSCSVQVTLRWRVLVRGITELSAHCCIGRNLSLMPIATKIVSGTDRARSAKVSTRATFDKGKDDQSVLHSVAVARHRRQTCVMAMRERVSGLLLNDSLRRAREPRRGGVGQVTYSNMERRTSGESLEMCALLLPSSRMQSRAATKLRSKDES